MFVDLFGFLCVGLVERYSLDSFLLYPFADHNGRQSFHSLTSLVHIHVLRQVRLLLGKARRSDMTWFVWKHFCSTFCDQSWPSSVKIWV